MPWYGNGVRCCCDIKGCSDIGYCNEGPIAFPSKEPGLIDAWLEYLKINTAKAEKIRANPRNYKLAFWHFPEDQRKWDANEGKWILVHRSSLTPVYKDDQNKKYKERGSKENVNISLLPCNNLDKFIRFEAIATRKAPTVRVPLPATSSTHQQYQGRHNPTPTTPKPSSTRKRRPSPSSATSASSAKKAKNVEVAYQILDRDNTALKREIKELKAKQITLKKKHEKDLANMRKTYESKINKMRKEREEEMRGIERKQKEQSEQHKKELSSALSTFTPLRYNMLRGKLSGMVRTLTNFDDINVLDAYIEALNIKRNQDDPGILTRLLRPGRVRKRGRKGQHKTAKISQGPKRKLGYKDEYLVYACRHAAGWRQEEIAGMFQISKDLVSNIVRSFATYQDMFFSKTMSNPTKDQILRNYPTHFVDVYGHARIKMILDCTDTEMEDSSLKLAHALLYSLYHAQTGAKFGIGCTPTGHVPHPWHSEANGSSISDNRLVDAAELLDLLAFGDIVLTDKGFLIENIASKKGVQVYRPSTFRDLFKQQGRGNTIKTQKVGNTRIIIEQVNREGKTVFRLWRGKFPLSQKDIITPLMRVGFMLANFKPAKLIGE